MWWLFIGVIKTGKLHVIELFLLKHNIRIVIKVIQNTYVLYPSKKYVYFIMSNYYYISIDGQESEGPRCRSDLTVCV